MHTEARWRDRRTRRDFLLASAAALGALAAPARSRADPAPSPDLALVQTFRSRPDLMPPAVAIATEAPAVAPGYVFVAPFTGPGQYGPLIVDNSGKPVWFLPSGTPTVHNFRTQTLAGKPVLTWWEGEVTGGLGQGECVIAGDSYEVLARLSGGNGYQPDLHEFVITSRDTALISVAGSVSQDLSGYGGPTDGTVVEGVVQELDIASGNVLFEWHSLDHVGLDESYLAATPTWDYFHLNSIGVDQDGNLLISARHTSTVYKLDRRSGEVIWRLGGKQSDFELGPGATFAFQHDARGHPDSLVSLFDDGASSVATATEPTSRAIVLALDTTTMTAQLVSAIANPHGSLATAMGNTQLLADGGAFVGWGALPEFSEFASDGELRFDATFAGGGLSYRAFRHPWVGSPAGRPALAVSRDPAGELDVFVSWNGATEVSHWQILGGAAPGKLHPLKTVARSGFETQVTIATPTALVAAVALDPSGRTLGRSRTLRV